MKHIEMNKIMVKDMVIIMRIEDIKKKYYNGDYNTKLPYVSGTKKYKDGHIFDKNMPVVWNEVQVAIENEKIMDAVKAYHNDQNNLAKQFTSDVVNALLINYDFTETACKKLEAKIYADNHHDMNSYFYELEEMATLIADMMSDDGETCSACSGSGYYCGKACGCCNGRGKV